MRILERKVIVLTLLLLVACSLLPSRSMAQQGEGLALLEKSFANLQTIAES